MTPRSRLNLKSLRRSRCAAAETKDPTLAQALEPQGGALDLSRRSMFGIAGAAALGSSFLGKALSGALMSDLEFSSSATRAVFKLAGEVRWVVDAGWFAGCPRLTVDRRSDGSLHLALSRARYPGTDLPADLSCTVRRSLMGWWIRLEMALGGFESEYRFDRWLAGAEPVRARVHLPAAGCDLGGAQRLLLSGAAEASFYRDWTLRLAGSGIATLTNAIGPQVLSDSVRLGLLGSSLPSLLDRPSTKRTFISLLRGDRAWRPLQALRAPSGGSFTGCGEPFDTIHIETGDDPPGRARRALVAEAGGNEAKLMFHPGGGLKATLDEPFGLPLRNPCFAMRFDPAGNETALIARFDEKPVWMQAHGCTLKLADGPGVPPFEVTTAGGEIKEARCEPALLSASAALAGALVEPASMPEQARAAFVLEPALVAQVRPEVKPRRPVIRKPTPTPSSRDEERQPVAKPGSRIVIQPDKAVSKFRIAPFEISVLRPEDLLVLRFRFINLALNAESGQPARLVRKEAGKPAYICVIFPPQHIAEEAFYERAANYNSAKARPAGIPAHPDDAKQNDDPLGPPPVRSRIAGDSRLVFEVPDEMAEVPYTLDALLSWTSYDPSVAPLALPPPKPLLGQLRLSRPILQAPAGKRGKLRTVTPSQTATGSRRTSDSGQWASVRATGVGPASRIRAPRPEEPKPHETAIEAPYRLLLSPSTMAGWIHSLSRVTRNKRTELWHTRLGVRSGDGRIYDSQYLYGMDDGTMRVLEVSDSGQPNDHYRTVRALWSQDYDAACPGHAPETPFRMSLDARDRCELVRLTADPSADPPDAADRWLQRTVKADRLMLSALGAWLNLHYGDDIPVGSGLSIEEWRHLAGMGRDQYVRVVYKGYLFPFGHRASLIKVTERKFEKTSSGQVAYLRQRMFIVVREPERSYPAEFQPNDARQLPFRTVRITTLVTPNLDPPTESKVDLPAKGSGGSATAYSAQAAFWPRVAGEDFSFHLVAEDWEDQRFEFTAPMIFVGVEDGVAFQHAVVDRIRTHYHDADIRRRKRSLDGQKIAFAQADKPGDTALETKTVTFGAELPKDANLSAEQFERLNLPRYYPTMEEAEVRVPAISQVTGQDKHFAVMYHAASYVKSGWKGNQGEVFLELVKPEDLKFGADKSGGVATPNMAIQGLSRQFGPIGGKDPNQLAGGTFSPEDFFDDSAMLLGGLLLSSIIKKSFAGGKNVPKLTSTPVHPGGNKLVPPTAVDTKLEWAPQVQQAGPFYPSGDTGFSINAKVHTVLDGSDSSSSRVEGVLTRFELRLFGFIALHFKKFSFTSQTGKKQDVGADIERVEFQGPLEFVNELKDYLPLGGPDDGPYLDVSPSGVRTGFTLPIPSIAVGVLTLQNITLALGVELPFTGAPVMLRFAFCTRENPFILTVSGFGGGGFFGLELGMDPELVKLEASLEFGGAVAFDIGVASGGVYIMAGIYFKYVSAGLASAQEPEGALLEGYVRLGGSVEVLGIITVSVEFYMGLAYETATNKVWGEARLEVKIDVLLFSMSVTLSVRREFGDPDRVTFAKLMPQKAHWEAYCDAFA